MITFGHSRYSDVSPGSPGTIRLQHRREAYNSPPQGALHSIAEENLTMKRICGLFACLLFFIPLIAQELSTEGAVWRVTRIRVKPAQTDADLATLRQATKPLLDEEKRQGIIVDYKVFFKETLENPQDWNIALAVGSVTSLV